MGKAIIVAAVIVIVLAMMLGAGIWYTRSEQRQADKAAGRAVKGDLSAAQEKALIARVETAETIFKQLIDAHYGRGGLDNVVLLPTPHINDIQNWLSANKTKRFS